MVLGLAGPVLVVGVGVNKIARPIHELTGAAQRVAEGDFSQTITANTGDEIEELANQFNHMAGELHGLYTDLERRVENRTKELSALNGISAAVAQSLDLEKMMAEALRHTLAMWEMESGAILLGNPKDGLSLRAVARVDPRSSSSKPAWPALIYAPAWPSPPCSRSQRISPNT